MTKERAYKLMEFKYAEARKQYPFGKFKWEISDDAAYLLMTEATVYDDDRDPTMFGTPVKECSGEEQIHLYLEVE